MFFLILVEKMQSIHQLDMVEKIMNGHPKTKACIKAPNTVFNPLKTFFFQLKMKNHPIQFNHQSGEISYLIETNFVLL